MAVLGYTVWSLEVQRGDSGYKLGSGGVYVKALSVVLFLACGATVAVAQTICPAAGGANPFTHPPDPSGTGCNVVITIAANGSVSVQVTDATPYEASEDVLVGVKNNSASTVGSLGLTGTNIFGFEGDGICTFTFVGSTYCSASQIAGTDPQDYQGPTSTFSLTNANTGTVTFGPAIPANGGSTYFSLEGVPTASLTVTVTPGGPPTPAAPIPGSLILLCLGLAGLVGWQFGPRVFAK